MLPCVPSSDRVMVRYKNGPNGERIPKHGTGETDLSYLEILKNFRPYVPHCRGTSVSSEDAESCAFVVLLFGSHPGYCMEAAVLGQSLQKTGTSHHMILLYTEEVPACWLDILQDIGWSPNLVTKIEGRGLYDGSQNNRFDGVFTKFHVLNLTQYAKVVMLDADLLVRRNIDCLFKKNTPAALFRGASADYPDDTRIPRDRFFDHRGRLVSGINAGVMVLKPSAEEFAAIIDDLTNGKRRREHRSRMPEQDYLTRFYAGRWWSLGVKFNFQPHQVAFCDRLGLERCRRVTIDFGDVCIVHFSALPKPRDWFFCPEYNSMHRMTFARVVLWRHYWEGLWTDRRRWYSSHDVSVIEIQLFACTVAGCLEWFQVWDELQEQVQTLSSMLEAATREHPLRPRPFSKALLFVPNYIATRMKDGTLNFAEDKTSGKKPRLCL